MASPSVTVMLNTVRLTDKYREDRDTLLCIADDLAKQSFTDFEFVAVDGLQPYRADTFKNSKYPFPITHVAPRASRMVRDHRVAISAYKNTGIMHARGELILTVDDCCWLDSNYVQRCWDTWSKEKLMLAALSWPINAPTFNDNRRRSLGTDGRCVGSRDSHHTPPMYGFASFSTEAALNANGYDEMMDGSQGLEDIEMGIRLQRGGARLVLDARHVVRTGPSSTPWDERLFPPGVDRFIKCCQSTLKIQIQRNLTHANKDAWGPGEWAQMTPCRWFTRLGNPLMDMPEGNRCNAQGATCAYPTTLAVQEHPELHTMRDEPSIFDLRALRAEALGL